MYNSGSGQRAREIVGNRQIDSQGGRPAGGDFCGCPPPRKYNRSPLDIGYISQDRHATPTRPGRAAKAQFTWADAGPPGSRRVPPEGEKGSRARASWRVEGRAPAAPQRRSSSPRGACQAASRPRPQPARTKTAPVVARARASARVRSSDNRAPSNTPKHKMPPKPTPNRS